MKPGIPYSRAYGIFNNLLRNILPYRGNGSDTASEPSVLFQGYKYAGTPGVHLFRQILRNSDLLSRLHICLYRLSGKRNIRIFCHLSLSDLLSLLLKILFQKMPLWIPARHFISADAVSNAKCPLMGQALCFYRKPVQRPGHNRKGPMAALCRPVAELLGKIKKFSERGPSHHIHNAGIILRSFFLKSIGSVFL